MKTRLFFVLTVIFLNNTSSKSLAQANTTLSNLVSPTAVNQSLVPNNNDLRDLGTATKSWRTLYIDSSIYLKDALFLQNKGVQNTFVGEDVGRLLNRGKSNAAFGYHALYTNKNGSSNTAVGSFALFKNTADNNTAVGYQALYSNTTGSPNTAVGWGALYANTTGIENTAVGQGALYQNIDGSNNLALGRGALFSNTGGYDNTANGFKALFYNINGTRNTAVGSEAIINNQSGFLNTAVGYQSLYSNFDGFENTAIGSLSLLSNISGRFNTAVGKESLEGNIDGIVNTAIGYSALNSNTTGIANTAVGSASLSMNTVGSHNTALGQGAGNDLSNSNNNTAIGDGAHISGSNSIVIGYNAATNTNNLALLGSPSVLYCGGYVGWTTYASDKRIKKEVKENVKGLDFINRLRPVTYHLDLESIYKIQVVSRYGKQADKMTAAMKADIDKSIKDKEAVLNSGFIAQEVEKAAQESGYDSDGIKKPQNNKDNYGLTYATFVVPLVKAVQELSKMNTDKDASIDSLRNENANLEKRLSKLEALMNVQATSITSATLQQNIPNPFTNKTLINYSIPSKFSSAQIIVTDKRGNTLKTINLAHSTGSVSIDASTLVAGAYQYSLIIDGRIINTKQMILSK